MCVYYHHGMSRPQVADGEDGIQTLSVAVNILNKQYRRADKGAPTAWALGFGLITHLKNKFVPKYHTGPRA
jgi:hypothetical protein